MTFNGLLFTSLMVAICGCFTDRDMRQSGISGHLVSNDSHVKGIDGTKLVSRAMTKLKNLCDQIDAAVTMGDNKMYLFSDQLYWEVDHEFRFLRAATYVQNRWGFHMKPPFDTILTFPSGQFASKSIFIGGNQWWRVTYDGRTEAHNVIDWKGWPHSPLNAAFVFNIGTNSSNESMVYFLFGSKYSVYKFGSDPKAMIAPTPVVVLEDAVVTKDNDLLFLRRTTDRPEGCKFMSDVMSLSASMNAFYEKALYLFGDHKYCKVDVKHSDRAFTCRVVDISELLDCNQSSAKVPEVIPHVPQHRVNPSSAPFASNVASIHVIIVCVLCCQMLYN